MIYRDCDFFINTFGCVYIYISALTYIYLCIYLIRWLPKQLRLSSPAVRSERYIGPSVAIRRRPGAPARFPFHRSPSGIDRSISRDLSRSPGCPSPAPGQFALVQSALIGRCPQSRGGRIRRRGGGISLGESADSRMKSVFKAPLRRGVYVPILRRGRGPSLQKENGNADFSGPQGRSINSASRRVRPRGGRG